MRYTIRQAELVPLTNKELRSGQISLVNSVSRLSRCATDAVISRRYLFGTEWTNYPTAT